MGPMEIKRLQITFNCTRNYIIAVSLEMICMQIFANFHVDILNTILAPLVSLRFLHTLR